METIIPPFHPGVNSPTPTSLVPHLLGTNGTSECSDLMSRTRIQTSSSEIPLTGLIRSTPVQKNLPDMPFQFTSLRLSSKCHSLLSNNIRCDEEWYPRALWSTSRQPTPDSLLRPEPPGLFEQLTFTVHGMCKLEKKKKRCTLNKKGSWNDNCFNGVTPNLSCYKTQINGAPEKRKSPSQNH